MVLEGGGGGGCSGKEKEYCESKEKTWLRVSLFIKRYLERGEWPFFLFASGRKNFSVIRGSGGGKIARKVA